MSSTFGMRSSPCQTILTLAVCHNCHRTDALARVTLVIAWTTAHIQRRHYTPITAQAQAIPSVTMATAVRPPRPRVLGKEPYTMVWSLPREITEPEPGDAGQYVARLSE